ncbi:MAG: GNAT family N-acetyltransferase [Candidatus Hodarchaeales archaeon]
MAKSKNILCYPVTSDRWNDLTVLFGKKGAYWGCWCMYWRLTNKEFNKTKPIQRKNALKQVVEKGSNIPGLLAYINDRPVGWIAVSPRFCYKRLVKSRVIKPVDEKPVWSIMCFFIHKDFRGQKVGTTLLEAAINYVSEQGAPAVEAYPIDYNFKKIDDSQAYVGTVSMFNKAGFKKVGDTKAKSGGKNRIIMRYLYK